VVGISRPRLIEETTGGMLWVAGLSTLLLFFPALALLVLAGPKVLRLWMPTQVAVIAATLFLVSMGLAWAVCPSTAKDIRRGLPASGDAVGGSHILDIDAVPFRFIRMPRKHSFDRGCVLYLGHANGQLVLYDVEHDSPLRLLERDYGGEALYTPHVGAVAQRCLDRSDAKGTNCASPCRTRNR
jgi:hypothetical protein